MNTAITTDPQISQIAQRDPDKQSPDPASSAVPLSVVEAKLAGGGTLVESPANGTHSGRKWRVLVFEYGLSKNRYPYRDSGFGTRDSGVGVRDNAAERCRSRLAESLVASHESRNDPADAGPFRPLPLLWTERSGRQALEHLEGARCFADHVSDRNGTTHSVRDLVGFFSEPALGPRGPEATLTLLASERWAREKLLAAWEAGRPELIGFSVDAVIAVRPAGEGADRVLEVEDIAAIHSVDMVSAPSSGGRALGVLEQARDSRLGIRDSGDNRCSDPESRIANSSQRSNHEAGNSTNAGVAGAGERNSNGE